MYVSEKLDTLPAVSVEIVQLSTELDIYLFDRSEASDSITLNDISISPLLSSVAAVSGTEDSPLLEFLLLPPATPP